jgi:predicted nucleotide-binding protein (sugar kinase/HSP70/actin superfamily)
MLKDMDYVLYPCAIRLGEKDGDASQKYSCPLVQASPFIIRSVLGFGERLLIPIIDFSRGDADVIKNLADVAVKMRFSRRKGKEAALAGIKSQRKFEADQAALGSELLEQLRQSGQLGVVLFARSYMSQDAGANLGIAEKLAQLGVVPIPLDFLPLKSVNSKDYSDRPYWFYENKYIAGADITVSDPQLYGLWLTNFGCGPNSFIIHIVEDMPLRLVSLPASKPSSTPFKDLLSLPGSRKRQIKKISIGKHFRPSLIPRKPLLFPGWRRTLSL